MYANRPSVFSNCFGKCACDSYKNVLLYNKKIIYCKFLIKNKTKRKQNQKQKQKMNSKKKQQKTTTTNKQNWRNRNEKLL